MKSLSKKLMEVAPSESASGARERIVFRVGVGVGGDEKVNELALGVLVLVLHQAVLVEHQRIKCSLSGFSLTKSWA